MSAGQIPTVGRGLPRQRSSLASARRSADGPVVLERYRLHRRLGAGGFGTVWLARDERLRRDVALKIIPPERIVGGRFAREARAAARLAHPGIVTLYEAAIDGAGAYLVSELVRGPTLTELLAAGRLSDRDVLAIGIALCDALVHAHAHGVVHRDVKPSNVLIPERPPAPAAIAKLTDFGVARVIGGDSLTHTGEVVGTADYMAPEQADGRAIGAPADLYALALVLYEGLSGINPIRTCTAAQRARRLGAHLPPIRRQRRDLPRELGRGIDLALRPRSRERGTIEGLRIALVASVAAVADEPAAITTRVRVNRSRAPLVPPVFSEHEWERDAADELAEDSSPPAAHPRLPLRVLASLTTAALTAWLLTHVLVGSSVPPAAGALLTGALVALLPRLGWATAIMALVTAIALQHRTGAALLVGLAALVPVLALPFAGSAWSLAAGAPALGAVGLAGAWPVLAARAGSAWRRAALGFTGWVWLVLAQPLAGVDLDLRHGHRAAASGAWMTSLQQTLHDVLWPLLRSGAFAPALVWAAAAVLLPWLVRGRSPFLDLIRVAGWSAVLVSATSTAITLAGGTESHPPMRGVVLGSIAGALAALAPTLVGLRSRGWARRRDPSDARAGVP